jgi:hypothetical protein
MEATGMLFWISLSGCPAFLPASTLAASSSM